MAHTTTESVGKTQVSRHWSSLSADPNSEIVLQQRAETLAAAWMPQVADRVGFIVERARGKRVLDLGCVAHDVERMKSNRWLHHEIAEAGDVCVGVDVLSEGVEAMNEAGYTAVVADLAKNPEALTGRGLFQIIVAGELIEHVGNLDMIFEAAEKYLTADGELIITTPNPYAPARVRAGRRGEIWENVDHIMYAFPSGIAELAERHGLLLAVATTSDRLKPRRATPLQWAKRTLRRSHYHRTGFSTTVGVVRHVIADRRDSLDRLADRMMKRVSSRHRFTGETAIYVVRRGTLP